MHPLEIVKRTPKTNCGECGHSTCLAFGAAVSAAGISPSLCPYIDLNGLDLGDIKAKDSPRDQDMQLVRHLKDKMSALNFAEIAAPLGVKLDDTRPDTLTFPYLEQQIVLTRGQDIRMDGLEPDDPRDQILLYNYLHSRGGRQPDDNWIGMESLPNSISKIKTLNIYCEERLAQLFTKMTPAAINELCSKIGGRVPEQADTSAQVFDIPVLPMLPQRILYWQAEPEDGFAAQVKILYDQNVMDFLDLESLVFSSERMADRLLYLAIPA